MDVRLNIYEFSPADYMDYCGGSVVVAAKTKEDAIALAEQKGIQHIGEGYIIDGAYYEGHEGVLLNSFYFE